MAGWNTKQSKGGKAVKGKKPPAVCPHDGCNESMQGRNWHSYLGHLGLHGLADNYFSGDIEAAQKHLRENGRARSDPFPQNGAWRGYRKLPLKDVDKEYPK